MFITPLLDDLNRDALIDLFGLSAVMDGEASRIVVVRQGTRSGLSTARRLPPVALV